MESDDLGRRGQPVTSGTSGADGVDVIHVVVPAHNEEQRLPHSLGAIATSAAHLRTRVPEVVARVTVVLDACTDGSAEVCRASGIDVVETCHANVGAARAIGVSRARVQAARGGVAPERVWIVCTDADSLVPVEWMLEQVELAAAGADVVLGRVEPDAGTPDVLAAQWLEAHPAGHVGVHGAHLGFRLVHHDAVGGFADLAAREDLDLYQRLLAGGARYAAARSVVLTSGRLTGRTAGGFAGYLSALARGSGSDSSPPSTTTSTSRST